MNSKTTPILIVLLVIAAFLIGMFYTKLQLLETGSAKPAAQASPAASSQPANPLSLENLKKNAADLGFDTKKFNSCLDTGVHADDVKGSIAYGQSLGVNGTPAFFINGRFLGGAFPFESFKEIIDKEIAGTGSDSPSVYSQTLQKYASGQPPSFIPKAVQVKIDPQDPVEGSSSAKVTIVEFSDFQCPYCIQADSTVKQILNAYKNDLRLVYKQFPLSQLHPFAQKAAEASLCALDQGKFWLYHDKLFESQGVNQ